MKRSRQEIEARRQALADLIREKGYQPVHELAHAFRVSEVTLRRDLAALEQEERVIRTHGGALVDDNLRFATFKVRIEKNRAQKREIAQRAAAMIKPGMSVYLDAGTTIYAVAEELRKGIVTKVKIMTPNLPVAEILLGTEGLDVFLTGGRLLGRQSSLVGELCEGSIRQWKFDLALMGAEGIDDDGLWNSSEELIQMQQTVLANTQRAIFCLDPSKSHHQGSFFLCRWKPQFFLISGA